ncbi:unnamed protein product [Staurois parvus]|uniref:Uncharacterized protein n=1 Tax=Staurois parvus TaxID=386267 RepID=A0ABN9H7V2_9NEOB|nr:unnamed protein product [Staurois parvus]
MNICGCCLVDTACRGGL